MGEARFLKDLSKAQEKYPFLELETGISKAYPFRLTDDFEVSDDEGNYWGSFRASIHFPKDYPKGAPVLQDKSKVFPWEHDWHTSPKEGECCVCSVIEKAEIAKKGITIMAFIKNYVQPFYANQLFKQEYGEYKNGDYSHYDEGVWESLEEEFKTKDRIKIRRFLNELKMKRGRNKSCFCGSGTKYKKCHLDRVDLIESVISNYKDFQSIMDY